MALNHLSQPSIGVVGLWHLGCTIAACWAKLGHQVRGVDLDEQVIFALTQGQPPVYEPGLEEAIRSGLASGALSISTSVETLRGCRFVFLAYDTPVRDDDSSDISVLQVMTDLMGPVLDPGTIVVVSAQLPVGTARQLRSRLKGFQDSIELVYSPENLRLGKAISCYTRPGHVVIGTDDKNAGDEVEKLFRPMGAACLRMNLPSAEMVKHAINSFLAASITLSNQWADLCEATGADFSQVAEALRHDPRIGQHAYLTPGIGFSGGTLGRDLQVLECVNRNLANGAAPVFGEIWRYNKSRVQVVRLRCERALGSVRGKRIGLLGMTYKPGTSTLRRSLPLEVAEDLLGHGVVVRAFDPKADWSEARLPAGLTVCDSPYEVLKGAELGVLLTEWPDFLELDYGRIKTEMARPILFDTKNMLHARRTDLEQLGFTVLTIGRG
ncbi:UDP-glucose dehydrogenase family protein [Nitrospira sp. Kam-Ns4a]